MTTVKISDAAFSVTFQKGRHENFDRREWRITTLNTGLVDALLPAVGKSVTAYVDGPGFASFKVVGVLDDLTLDSTGGVRIYLTETVTSEAGA